MTKAEAHEAHLKAMERYELAKCGRDIIELTRAWDDVVATWETYLDLGGKEIESEST